ncbi:hypothetical protein CR513_10009, partial [Mucuna pruriens]
MSLLEVANLEEAETHVEEEEAETHVEEEEATMAEVEVTEDQTNGLEFVRRIIMKRKIDGIKASHMVTIAKGSGTFKRIVTLAISNTIHLPKQKMAKGTCSLLVKRGKEYIANEFEKFYEDEGVERQLTVGYTSQQNGVSKKKN